MSERELRAAFRRGDPVEIERLLQKVGQGASAEALYDFYVTGRRPRSPLFDQVFDPWWEDQADDDDHHPGAFDRILFLLDFAVALDKLGLDDSPADAAHDRAGLTESVYHLINLWEREEDYWGFDHPRGVLLADNAFGEVARRVEEGFYRGTLMIDESTLEEASPRELRAASRDALTIHGAERRAWRQSQDTD